MLPLLAQSEVAHRGLLPTRGSFMLDFVFLAMFGVLLVMAWSIFQVRYRFRYQLHKRVQLALALVLLLAVTAFEIDLNFITVDWRPLAKPSPYFAAGWVDVSLYIHLAFAVPTPLLWLVVIVLAVRRFPNPATPNEHSRLHVVLARVAAAGMTLTAVTGWVFYWLAFVAT